MNSLVGLGNSAKFIIGWAIVLGIRFLPFRAPNVEPVLAVQMPFAHRFGAVGAFVFGAASITAFDVISGAVGHWTWVTALAYGLVGVGAAFFFRNGTSTGKYLGYSVIGTLFFDAATGLTIGPIFYAQPFRDALVGQIPFTILHLMGNMLLAIVLSPAIERWLVENPRLAWGAPSVRAVSAR